MNLNELKENSSNPRFIRDDKFKKLVQSIKDFPKMMELRPIIIDNDNVILGGNMRFKALKELKYKEVPDTWIKQADTLTEDEKKRFIITDNVGFGEWDFDMLANNWDETELKEWGMDIPVFDAGVDENSMNENDINLDEEFNTIGASDDKQRVVFIFENTEEAETYLSNANINNYSKTGAAWQVIMSSQSI